MKHTDAVIMAMAMFAEEFGRKFEISKTRVDMWCKFLEGFTPDCIMAAATHILRTSKSDFPPPVGKVCDVAYNLSNGKLHAQTGEEAWENINRSLFFVEYTDTTKIEKPTISDMEQRAMDQVGDAWYFKHSSNPAQDRLSFIKAFNQLSDQQRDEKLALPEVRKVVDKNKLLQEGEKRKILPEVESTNPTKNPEYVDPEMISKFCADLEAKMAKRDDR